MNFDTRYDFLKATIARYDGYYHLAAVKGSLLLTTDAVLLAPALGEGGRVQDTLAAGGPAQVLMMLASALALVSILFAALVITSSISRRQAIGYHSLMFTESVSDSTAEQHERGVRRATEDSVIDDLSHLAHLLASGVTRKFRYVNYSLAALVGAVALAVTALLLR